MDNLRWILLLLGVLVIAGVYAFTVISKKQKRDKLARQFSTVDWEEGGSAKKAWPDENLPPLPIDEDADHNSGENFAEWNDDLPSLEELENARIQHRAEGFNTTRSEAVADSKLNPQDSSSEPITKQDLLATPSDDMFEKEVDQHVAQGAEQLEANQFEPSQFENGPAAQKTNPVNPVDELIIPLHIKAKDSIGFYGPKLHACLDELGIKHGDLDIYHYSSQGKRILSIANMVEPGTFDLEKIKGFTTPGITIFLQLNINSDFELAEKALIQSAKYIAHKLDGEILVDKHKMMTSDKEKEIVQQIRAAKETLKK